MVVLSHRIGLFPGTEKIFGGYQDLNQGKHGSPGMRWDKGPFFWGERKQELSSRPVVPKGGADQNFDIY